MVAKKQPVILVLRWLSEAEANMARLTNHQMHLTDWDLRHQGVS